MGSGDSFLDGLQVWTPVLGGFGALIWIVWRLFWKVDMRSQKDIAAKEILLASKDKTIQEERVARFAAEERASRAESREDGLEDRIKDLTAQLKELKDEVMRLRMQLNPSSPHFPPPSTTTE